MTTDGEALATDDLTAAYVRDRHALYRYCRSIVRHEDDAHDALQSAMTRAVAATNRPRGMDLRPWLFRIAHNESVSILRRRRPLVELDAELPALGGVYERVEAQETLRLLHQDLADLSTRQRTALILRELNGLRTAEIAALLETTPGAVKQTILEARRALSNCDEGRATPCFEVQEKLSHGDGRALGRRGLRAHLRSCSSCRRFRDDLERRPAELKALAPLPAGAAGLLGWLQASGAGGLLTKTAACVAVMTAAATGARALERAQPPAEPVHTVATRPATVRRAPVPVVTVRAAATPQQVRADETRAQAPATRHRRATAPGHKRATHGKPAAAPGHTAATPGKSAAAPGHTGATPGKSAAAPGHTGATPGKSAAAPGHTGATPGKSAAAPGHTGATPGKSAAAPGHTGATPGKSAAAPGHTGATPGKSADAPGHADTDTAPPVVTPAPAAPGKSADAPGHLKKS